MTYCVGVKGSPNTLSLTACNPEHAGCRERELVQLLRYTYRISLHFVCNMLRLLRGVSPQRMLFHEYLPQKVNSPFVIPELQLSDSSKKIILPVFSSLQYSKQLGSIGWSPSPGCSTSGGNHKETKSLCFCITFISRHKAVCQAEQFLHYQSSFCALEKKNVLLNCQTPQEGLTCKTITVWPLLGHDIWNSSTICPKHWGTLWTAESFLKTSLISSQFFNWPRQFRKLSLIFVPQYNWD